MTKMEEVLDILFENRDEAKDYIKYVIDYLGWDRQMCEDNYGIFKLVLKHNIYYKYSKEEVMKMGFEE